MIPKPNHLATLPFLLLPLLLLLIPPDLTNGAQVRQIETCFPDELPKPPDPNFSKDITKFGLKLFKGLLTSPEGSQSSENVVVSPFSVWSALVLAYLSSEGRTHDELKRALKLETKIGTHSDWAVLKRQLTQARNLRVDSPSTTKNRQPRQVIVVSPVGVSTYTQTKNQESSQMASEDSNSKQSLSEGTSTVTINSNMRVEQCTTDTNGVRLCSTDDSLTGSEASTTTDVKEATSSSSTGTGTSSGSTSSNTMTSCTNGVCTTTDTSSQEGMSETETCETDNDGVMTCMTETCTTDATGAETCTTETCTTDAEGVETCTRRRRRKRDETGGQLSVARSGGRLRNGEISPRKSVAETETQVLPESETLATNMTKPTVLPKSGYTKTLTTAKKPAVLPKSNKAKTLKVGSKRPTVLPKLKKAKALTVGSKRPTVLPKLKKAKTLTVGSKRPAVLPKLKKAKTLMVDSKRPAVLPKSKVTKNLRTTAKEATVSPKSKNHKVSARDIKKVSALPSSEVRKAEEEPPVLPESTSDIKEPVALSDSGTSDNTAMNAEATAFQNSDGSNVNAETEELPVLSNSEAADNTAKNAGEVTAFQNSHGSNVNAETEELPVPSNSEASESPDSNNATPNARQANPTKTTVTITSNSDSNSAESSTTCVNGVCTTVTESEQGSSRVTETCNVDLVTGVETCVIETCTTVDSGPETCTTETCTTDAMGTETCVRRRRRRDEMGVSKRVVRSGRRLRDAETFQVKGVRETETPLLPESENAETGGEMSVLLKSGNTETLAKDVEEASALPETENSETLATRVEETAVLPSSEVDGNLAINPKVPAVLPKQTHTIGTLTGDIIESAVLPQSEISETLATDIEKAAVLPSSGVDSSSDKIPKEPPVLPDSDAGETLATDNKEPAVLPISDATETLTVENKKPEELVKSEATDDPTPNTDEPALLPKQSHNTEIEKPAVLPKSDGGETQATDIEEPAVSPEQTRTTTQKNCTKDVTGTESCTIKTCITEQTGATTCTTTEETKARSNLKAGTVPASGTTTFTSKSWAYFSDTLRLRTCLPLTLPEIMTIDFSRTTSAANIINAEVQKATEGVIDSLVEPRDLAGAEFMLLNAVHFKGEWATSFPVGDTTMADFYASPPPATPIGKVEMMRVVGNFKYASTTDLNASALLLPYASSSFSLLLLLPQRAEVGVQGVIERLNFKRLQEAINKAQDNEVEVNLPKFSMKSHHSQGLKEALSSVGVSQLFSAPLNLSPLTSTPLRLHSIIQQAAIQVDEQGTTFAAATGLIGTRLGPVKVRFDSPFIFLLMDMKHLIPVAAGVYRKPTA